MNSELATIGSRCFTIKPNYPKAGVTFYDMSPLLADHRLRARVIDQLASRVSLVGATHVLVLESRGYLIGSVVADRIGAALVPVRKTANALKAHAPEDLVTQEFDLEYKKGESIALPRGSLPAGARVLIIDDILATAGTAIAAARLARAVQPDCLVVGVAALLELAYAEGKANFEREIGREPHLMSLFYVLSQGEDEDIYDMPSVTTKPRLLHLPIDSNDRRAVLMWHPTMAVLAKKLLKVMASQLRASEIHWDYFADGWPNVKFEHRDTLNGKDVIFLAGFHDKNLIMEQISIMIAVPRQLVKSLRVFAPYFGPATMERVSVEGELATAETLAKMCSACLPSTQGGPPILTFFDIHALGERFYFDDRATIVFETAIPLIKKIVVGERGTVIFPDEGAFKRFYQDFKDVCPILVFSKMRGEGDSRKMVVSQEFLSHSYGPNVDPWKQPAFIIDDLVQSGSTLEACALTVRADYHFSHVNAFVTHAIFPKNSFTRFILGEGRKTFDAFYVTNSNPTVSEKLASIGEPFVVLDIVPLLAKILKKALPSGEMAPVDMILCSKSALKRQAVLTALERVGADGGIKLWCIGVNQLDLNPKQPIGRYQIKCCMMKRLEATMTPIPCVYISIESGLIELAEGKFQEATLIGVFTTVLPFQRNKQLTFDNVEETWVYGPLIDPKEAPYIDLMPKVLAAQGQVTLGELLHAADRRVPADAWYNREELIVEALVGAWGENTIA